MVRSRGWSPASDPQVEKAFGGKMIVTVSDWVLAAGLLTFLPWVLLYGVTYLGGIVSSRDFPYKGPWTLRLALLCTGSLWALLLLPLWHWITQ